MIPYFIGGITSVVPKGTISLDFMLNSIKKPSNKMNALINDIRIATETGDKERKTILKSKLPYFTPAVNLTYRNYQSIVSFNGLGVLDFDKLESTEIAIILKNDLFEKYKSIISVWLSASGHGVRAIFKIPVVQNVQEYKEYYKSFALEMQQYQGYDNACINPIQPLYYSFDNEILIRKNPIIWNNKIDTKLKRKRIIIKDNFENTENLIKYAKNRISNIQEDGHPILFNIVKNCQKYIDGGLVSRDEAVNILKEMINENDYLCRPQKKNDYLRILKILKDERENI